MDFITAQNKQPKPSSKLGGRTSELPPDNEVCRILDGLWTELWTRFPCTPIEIVSYTRQIVCGYKYTVTIKAKEQHGTKNMYKLYIYKPPGESSTSQILKIEKKCKG